MGKKKQEPESDSEDESEYEEEEEEEEEVESGWHYVNEEEPAPEPAPAPAPVVPERKEALTIEQRLAAKKLMFEGDDPSHPRTWTEALAEEANEEEASFSATSLMGGAFMKADAEEDEIARKRLLDRQKPPPVDPFALISPDTLAEIVTSSDYGMELHTGSESFKSTKYLQIVHHNTPYFALKEGVRNLSAEHTASTEILTVHIDNHLDKFVICKDTIDGIYSQIEANEISGSRSTAVLLSKFQDAYDKANLLFGNVIKRKQEIKQIKMALSLLQKHQDLLMLPSTIKQAIDLGDLDKVVRDFERVKWELYNNAVSKNGVKREIDLKGGRTIKSLSLVKKRVMMDIENLIYDLCNDLTKQISDQSVSLNEKRRLLKYLIVLDNNKDGYILFLEKRKEGIENELKKTMNHTNNEDSLRSINKITHILVNSLPELQIDIQRFNNEASQSAKEQKGKEINGYIIDLIMMGVTYIKSNFNIVSANKESVSVDSIYNNEELIQTILHGSTMENNNNNNSSSSSSSNNNNNNNNSKINITIKYVNILLNFCSRLWELHGSSNSEFNFIQKLAADILFSYQIYSFVKIKQQIRNVCEVEVIDNSSAILDSIDEIISQQIKSINQIFQLNPFFATFETNQSAQTAAYCIITLLDCIHEKYTKIELNKGDPNNANNIYSLLSLIYICLQIKADFVNSIVPNNSTYSRELSSLCKELIEILLSKYVRSKMINITDILREGIEASVLNESLPREVDNASMMIMTLILESHSELTRYCKGGEEEVMRAIVEGTVQSFALSVHQHKLHVFCDSHDTDQSELPSSPPYSTRSDQPSSPSSKRSKRKSAQSPRSQSNRILAKSPRSLISSTMLYLLLNLRYIYRATNRYHTTHTVTAYNAIVKTFESYGVDEASIDKSVDLCYRKTRKLFTAICS